MAENFESLLLNILMDKLPPQNIEAEQSVLGALMIDKNAIIKVADFLEARDFYKPVHQKIYEAMFDIYGRKEPIDILSVSSRLKEKNFLDEIGGLGYLTSLVNSVPTASHIAGYAEMVHNKRILRDLISASYDIAEIGFNEKEDIDTILDDAQQKLFQIQSRGVRKQFFHLRQELGNAFERIDKLNKGDQNIRGVTTGFSGLDNLLAGFQRANLIILAARPSLGKTSLALDIVRAAALDDKIPVGIFTLEMSREEIVDRFISAEAGVDLWRIRTGKLKKEEGDFEKIRRAIEKLSTIPVFVDDTPSPNIMQIRTMARRLQMEHGLGMLVVDYLQLIPSLRPYDSEVQQVSEVSRSLKSLARELNVPVLAISQLNRAVEQRETKVPRLADLRASGTIEQDADVVMFIYRKDRDKAPESLSLEEINVAEIRIEKHRNGPLGVVRLKFNPETASFREIDEIHSF